MLELWLRFSYLIVLYIVSGNLSIKFFRELGSQEESNLWDFVKRRLSGSLVFFVYIVRLPVLCWCTFGLRWSRFLLIGYGFVMLFTPYAFSFMDSVLLWCHTRDNLFSFICNSWHGNVARVVLISFMAGIESTIEMIVFSFVFDKLNFGNCLASSQHSFSCAAKRRGAKSPKCASATALRASPLKS